MWVIVSGTLNNIMDISSTTVFRENVETFLYWLILKMAFRKIMGMITTTIQ